MKASRQAKAIIELYETMPEKVQRQIRRMILEKEINFNLSGSKELSKASESSLKDIWDNPENEHWDDYFESLGDV